MIKISPVVAVDWLSEYRRKGIWGMWCDYFASSGASFFLSAKVSEFDYCWDDQGVPSRAKNLPALAWSYCPRPSFELKLASQLRVSDDLAVQWAHFVEFELFQPWDYPTFFPRLLPDCSRTQALNVWLERGERVFFANGQPGSGKRSFLQCVALASHFSLPDGASLLHASESQEGFICYVPELALLEPVEQSIVMDAISGNGLVLVSSAYSLDLLVERELLRSNLAELLSPKRVVLSPWANLSLDDQRCYLDFHRAVFAAPSGVGGFDSALWGDQEKPALGDMFRDGREIRSVVAEIEVEAIRAAYQRAGKSQHRVAEILGISRGSLQHKLRKFKI